MTELWIEKYRPKNFEEIVGQEHVIKRVKSMVKDKNLPHLLLIGPAGTGKTSLVLVMAYELYKERWRENILELNASDSRGIDVIRNEVKNFAKTKPIGSVPFKICILDEADALTKEAQQALRRTMEKYSTTCRFCLLANYGSKIIEPIQSRCAIFRFKPLTKQHVKKIVEKVAKQENLKIQENAYDYLLEVSQGDVRRLLNILQSAASISKNITVDNIKEIVSEVEVKDVKQILEPALKGDFVKARDKLLEVMLNNGLSGIDIIKNIQKEILNTEIQAEKKLGIIERCGEIEFRIVEGSDEFIQLEALLAYIACLK